MNWDDVTPEEAEDDRLCGVVLGLLTEQETHTLDELLGKNRHLEVAEVFRTMISQGLLIEDEDGGVTRAPELGLKFDLPGVAIHQVTGELVNDYDTVSIEQAAAEYGLPVSELIEWMTKDGMILEHPNGGYFPSPHPDLEWRE